jgi:L-ascorbate metabolism protein UlaG (beta-lactamase superfamily)
MPNEARHDTRVRLRWLGVSSWVFSCGEAAVVVDPFFSRPSLGAVVLSLALPRLARPLAYDASRIREVLPDLPDATRIVLVTHAHYDHLLDIPYYVARPHAGCLLFGGSPTALNLLRGFPQVPEHTWEAKDGSGIRVGNVRVTAFATDHAPQVFGLCLMTGNVDTAPGAPPQTAGDYREGQTFGYLVDFMDGDAVAARIFVNGAASSTAGAASLRAHHALIGEHTVDVAVLCVPGWDQVDGYPSSVLDVLRPRVVVTSHFDNFFRRYRAGQDPRTDMDFVPLARYAGFVRTLRRLQDEHQYAYVVREPRTGEWLEVPGATPPSELPR